MRFNSPELEDEFKAIQLSKDDPRHFEYIYKRHFAAIYTYVKSATNEKHLSADLTQDIFYSALINLHTFIWNESGIRPWLFGIANNKLRMFFRNSKRMMYLPLDDFKLDQMLDGNLPLDLKERRRLVAGFLSTLSIEEQELIQLRFVAEASFKEIAVSLELSEEACKMRLYRLLDKIKIKLQHSIKS
jgi:RNA polymerase sigma-70 factor, ECF subfamily